MKAFWIFVAVVVVIASFAIYFLWWKPSQAGAATSTGSGGSSTPAPVPQPEPLPAKPPIGKSSVKVDAADIASALDPAIQFNNVAEDQMAAHNLLGSPGSNPTLIHFETGFANACSKYVWYKGWMYVNIGEKDSGGVKTCYYHVAQEQLPAEIRVYIPFEKPACSGYHFYLSGTEYLYTGTATETAHLTMKKFCIYKKS